MTDNSPVTDEEVAAAADCIMGGSIFTRYERLNMARDALNAASRIRAETAKNSGEVAAWPLRELLARAMAYRAVGDPDAKDVNGKSRWHWYEEDAQKFIDIFGHALTAPATTEEKAQPTKWRVFENIFRGEWGIEVDDGDGDDVILPPRRIDREYLDEIVSRFNALLALATPANSRAEAIGADVRNYGARGSIFDADPIRKAAWKVVLETDLIHDNEPWPIKYRAPYEAIAELRALLQKEGE